MRLNRMGESGSEIKFKTPYPCWKDVLERARTSLSVCRIQNGIKMRRNFNSLSFCTCSNFQLVMLDYANTASHNTFTFNVISNMWHC